MRAIDDDRRREREQRARDEYVKLQREEKASVKAHMQDDGRWDSATWVEKLQTAAAFLGRPDLLAAIEPAAPEPSDQDCLTRTYFCLNCHEAEIIEVRVRDDPHRRTVGRLAWTPPCLECMNTHPRVAIFVIVLVFLGVSVGPLLYFQYVVHSKNRT